MTLLGLIPVLASVLLAGTGRLLARRLSARAALPLLTLLALATSLATGAVLCLAAFVVLARQPFLASAGGWSYATWRPWAQVPAGWGVLAASIAAVLLAAAGIYLARAARDIVRAQAACRVLAGSGGLVVTQDERPSAYTVAGRSGTIVVSAGMLAVLNPAERRALLAHEAAHLRRHHAGYVLLARLAAAANPLLRPLARSVQLAAELEADQDAAAKTGDGRVVATALARASLAAGGQDRQASHALALAESDVAVRVRALTGGPPRLRPWAAAIALGLAVACGGAAAACALATHQQIEVAQLAYSQARAHAGSTRLARADRHGRELPAAGARTGARV